ncbi:MAG: endonuclease domain-containing protein [Mesorhizobium sp.]
MTTRVKSEMRQKALSLRHSLTKGEVLLWLELRELKAHGLHFRKQAPIGPYIVDFASHAARLVVEVDGDLHETDTGKRHDANRDAYLRSLGYDVLRFDYPDVISNPCACAQEVATFANDPTRPLRVHLPSRGRERPEHCAIGRTRAHD